MREELRQLWKVERPQVTRIVHEATKNGDRSENGDYIYGKRRLREIDRRVRYLSKRLELATIVDKKPLDLSKVFFAAWVTVEDQNDPAGSITPTVSWVLTRLTFSKTGLASTHHG